MTVPATEQLSAYQIAARANGYQFAALFPDARQMPAKPSRSQITGKRLIIVLRSVKPFRSQNAWTQLTDRLMLVANMATVCYPPDTGHRCSHAKRLSGRPQSGSCRQPCRVPADQTDERHRLRGLGCPVAELPPILITDRGNQFFIFALF